MIESVNWKLDDRRIFSFHKYGDRFDLSFIFICKGYWDEYLHSAIKNFLSLLLSFSKRDEDLSDAFKTRYREDHVSRCRKGKITGNPATGGVIIIFQNHHLREHVTLVRP